MKPVSSAAAVAKPPAEAYAFLDLLPNHEAFLDHYLTDWKFSGPERGLGAKAEARVNTRGSQDWFDFEVVETEQPRRIVEQASSAGGKRRTRGTYLLEESPDGGTEISFQLEFLQTPRSERLTPFLARAFAKRINDKAMRRLAKLLDG